MRSVRSFRAFCFASIALAMAVTANSQVITYVESVDGSFSSNANSPTLVGTFGVGLNTVSGVANEPGQPAFRPDFFTFDVAPGHQLDAMTVIDTSNGDHFLTFTFGATAPGHPFELTAGNSSPFPANGGTLFRPNTFLFDVNAAIPYNNLHDLSVSFGGPGFTMPGTTPFQGGANGISVPTGSYTVFVQDNTPEPNTSYTFGFNVSAVPEPSSFTVLGLASAWGVIRRRRRA